MFQKRKIDYAYVTSHRSYEGFKQSGMSVKQNDSQGIKDSDKIVLSDGFQDQININLFGMNVSQC